MKAVQEVCGFQTANLFDGLDMVPVAAGDQ